MESNAALSIAPQPSYEYITEPASATSALFKLDAAKILYFDTEVADWVPDQPHTGKLRLITLSDRNQIYVFDWFKLKGSGMAQEFKRVMAQKGIVGHYLQYDFFHLKREMGFIPRIIFDTCLCSKLLGGGQRGLSVSLKDCLDRHCGVKVDKTLQASDWSGELSYEQLQYAADDVVYLPDLATILIEKLNTSFKGQFENNRILKLCWHIHETFGLNHLASLVELSFLPAVVAMEFTGIKIDRPLLNESKNNLDLEFRDCYMKFKDQLPHLEPTQSVALAKMLESQGAKIPKTEKGNHRFDKAVLASLASDYPIVGLIQKLRYLKDKINLCNNLDSCMDVEDRVHTHFSQVVATSSRMSSSDPNIQNIPRDKKWRRLVVARPGNVLVIGDFPQIEMRIVAIIMRDLALKTTFEMRRDCYVEAAKSLNGEAYFLSLDAATQKDFRQKAKAVELGLSFAMSAETLVSYAHDTFGVNMRFEDADKYRSNFLAAHSGIDEYIRSWRLRKDYPKPANVYTLLGRRIMAHSVNEYANYPVQSSAAELLKLAILIFRDCLLTASIPALLVNLAHDEIVTEVEEQKAGDVARHMKLSMAGAGQLLGIPIHPEDIDVKIVKNWGDAK